MIKLYFFFIVKEFIFAEREKFIEDKRGKKLIAKVFKSNFYTQMFNFYN